MTPPSGLFTVQGREQTRGYSHACMVTPRGTCYGAPNCFARLCTVVLLVSVVFLLKGVW